MAINGEMRDINIYTQLFGKGADNGSVMEMLYKIGRALVFLAVVAMVSCSDVHLFSGYERVDFPVTRVTESSMKTVQILNESQKDIQHIIDLDFDKATNEIGYFQMSV